MQKWIFAVFFLASAAYAGDDLHFRNETYDLASVPSNVLTKNPTPQVTIVQFQNAITREDTKYLRSQRQEILRYIPEDALVIYGPPFVLIPSMKRQLAMPPEVKLSSDFPAMSVFNQNQEVEALVACFPLFDCRKISTSGNVIFQSQEYFIVRAPAAELRRLAKNAQVETVQPVPQFQEMTMDLEFEGMDGKQVSLDGSESGMNVIGAERLWSQGLVGTGLVAAMSDTGLDSGDVKTLHVDFTDAIKAGQTYGLFAKSWNDPMGHGTHVAGSIVGRGNGSNGQLRGGAFGAQFVAQSLWSPMLNNLSIPNKLADLFNGALREGAVVHSNSWGSPKSAGAYDYFATQVDDWTFKNPDLLVLFAAGNEGQDLDKDGRIDANSMATPATAKNCLTVGASENQTKTGGIQVPISKLKPAAEKWPAEPINSSLISDRADGIAMFSSRGPTADGRTKPDVLAPGTNILSTASHVQGASEMWGRYDSNYVWAGGTSMATPITAGAAVLVHQTLQKKFAINKPTASLVKATLMHSARDLYPGQYGQGGAKAAQEILQQRPNSDEGFGRVDLAGFAALNPSSTFLVDERVGVGLGETKTYEISVQNGQSLTVNMVYSDAPGSANAAKSLVNNLDLILEGPGGKQVVAKDSVNNWEYLHLKGLEGGIYHLQVQGANVPMGINNKQPYALIWTVK